jgi:tRNA-2-methylthio-N6-dimethylallyladenosine synthase
MKYFIWILGCAMNNSDAERIATVMELLGYTKTEAESEADVLITVACSVRQKAIDRIHGKVKEIRRYKAKNPDFKAILTGCVLEKDKKEFLKDFDAVLPIDDIGTLPSLLSPNHLEIDHSDLNENLKLKIENCENDYLSLTPHYESHFRAYVPIMTGCNNFCSYCAVPYTRGREKSRPEEEILAEVKKLIESGYKEITFLGQNVNSYENNPKDLSHNPKSENRFVELLKKLDKIPGEWRGYFYSNHPKDISEELLCLMPTLKHFPAYLHFPLQSGSDRILKEMHRHYNQSQYLEGVGKIRAAMPEMTLTTDIIVGYPGETEADFEETLKVMRQAKYDMVFSAQYSPRPGSQSAKLPDDVPLPEKKRREKLVIELTKETSEANNQRFIGRVERVLVDEKKKDTYFARTAGYKVVEIKLNNPEHAEGSLKKNLKIGEFVDVRIDSIGPWKLQASLLN